VLPRFAIGPGVDVTGGRMPAIDTGSISAVIAIDSTVRSLAPAIDRFVRSGGGVILAGSAGGNAAVSSLAPGALGARTRPAVKPSDTLRLGATGFYPVSALKSDGIALERRAGGIAVAARRVGAGRVIEIGYDDSWRWRMAGGPGSEQAHREWWSNVVASAAYAPIARPGSYAANADAAWAAAPVAGLVQAIGPARASPAPIGRPTDPRILSTLIMILLLLEWGSRRLRGKR
jgi:hypothetical protein